MRLVLFLAFNALMLLDAYRFTDETDKQALLEFKSQVSQGKRSVLSSWNSSVPLCSWTGVTCGRKHKRVASLDLAGLELGGVISPSIGNLSFLISLDLSNNSFGGTIPQEMGNLFRLQLLSMAFNFLRGAIPASLFNFSRLSELQLHSNPSEIGSLTKLVVLDLGRNNLKGMLPASLGNLTSLIELSFGGNYIEGRIPDDMAKLTQIEVLDLSANNFSGVFPFAIYNFSTLEYLDIFGSGFSGRLRPDFGNLLTNLRGLYMGNNSLEGAIPTTLANISTLQELSMEENRLTGSIPPSFGKLENLQRLELFSNYLGSNSVGDLDFLSALTNCTQLQTLAVGDNTLGGDLPASIANLSTSLIHLSLYRNLISGIIPREIGNLVNLQNLALFENLLSGPLPASLGKLSRLVVLSASSNRISGPIPSSIGNITRLVKMNLQNNSFEGIIPPALGNCNYMIYLAIGYNKLNGTIPKEIMQISPLVILDVSNNSLTGSLPKEVGQLLYLGIISAAHNKLSGKLPETLGKCLAMEQLYLRGNSFEGTIPDLSGLVGVKRVDFSNNNLSGTIPGYFANFNSLESLNLSLNNLEGKVPTQGKFKNATLVSVFGNKNLCGGISELQLKPCSLQAQVKGTKGSSRLKKAVVGVSIGVFLLAVSVVSVCWLKKRNKNKTNEATPSALGAFHEIISYGDLRNATEGFSSTNLIGSGSFGTVFKAVLPAENKVVVVKVLNLERRGAMKSFMAECESLKDIRHRNLVKLLTACSSIDSQGNDFRALIYEFLPNGSLDMWLHPEEVEKICRPSRALTLLERLNIVVDVASVLEYLHVHCRETIAHCDLKPSNVLLEDDLTTHVSDFGLARILDQESFLNQLSSAGVRGTIGYAAPEYGMGGQISIHGDIYSFGILLLEMFSGKRPTNELFGGNFTLRSYINSALPERVLEVMDESILHNGLRVGFPIAECLKLVLEMGLRCCEESPMNRMAMTEAVKELISIKERFFKARRTTRR